MMHKADTDKSDHGRCYWYPMSHTSVPTSNGQIWFLQMLTDKMALCLSVKLVKEHQQALVYQMSILYHWTWFYIVYE